MTAQPAQADFALPQPPAAAPAVNTASAASAVDAAQRPTPLPLRHDTFLGICEGLGSDLGFHPNWLRVALALGLFYSVAGAILAYLALGLIVLATRLIAPDKLIASPETAQPANSNEALRRAA